MLRTLYISSFLFFISFCVFTSCVKEEKVPGEVVNHVVVGDRIPDFSIDDGAGNLLSSQDFLGKQTLLVFFDTDCKDCQRELPKAEKVCLELKEELGFQVFSIARGQNKKETDEYWKENGYTMPKYLDPERKVFSLFANRTIPRFYIIDSSGIIQWMGIEKINLTSEQIVEKMKNL